MTVAALTSEMTLEEMKGWAGFFEIKAEEEEKVMDRAKTARGAQTMRRR